MDEKIRRVLNVNLYREFMEKKIKITEEEFKDLNPFHRGFEFYDLFDPEKLEEERGFDVVVGNPPYVRADTDNEFMIFLKNFRLFPPKK
jgi:Eco57I restriction endonuclease.